MDTKLIAQAIATANAGRPSYRGVVLNADGSRAGYVHYMGGLCRSTGPAVSLVSDAPNGADLQAAFERLLGCDMPQGGRVEVRAKRKAVRQ